MPAKRKSDAMTAPDAVPVDASDESRSAEKPAKKARVSDATGSSTKDNKASDGGKSKGKAKAEEDESKSWRDIRLEGEDEVCCGYNASFVAAITHV